MEWQKLNFFSPVLGRVDVAKLLIENGAEINAKNKKGETPLYLAAEAEKYDENRGWMVNFIDFTGRDNTMEHREKGNQGKVLPVIQILMDWK